MPDFTGPKIWIDQIQIYHTNITTGLLVFDRQVDGYFGFAATVITDDDDKSFKMDMLGFHFPRNDSVSSTVKSKSITKIPRIYRK